MPQMCKPSGCSATRRRALGQQHCGSNQHADLTHMFYLCLTSHDCLTSAWHHPTGAVGNHNGPVAVRARRARENWLAWLPSSRSRTQKIVMISVTKSKSDGESTEHHPVHLLACCTLELRQPACLVHPKRDGFAAVSRGSQLYEAGPIPQGVLADLPVLNSRNQLVLAQLVAKSQCQGLPTLGNHQSNVLYYGRNRRVP